MLLSTLPDLQGRTYAVRGVVFDCGEKTLIRRKVLENLFNSIIQQASDMGADAIVDIRVTKEGSVFMITGTAVKLR